jgi:hypothetical protein
MGASFHGFVHGSVMIAPKSLWPQDLPLMAPPMAAALLRGCNHAFVNRFILLPKFSLAQVAVG